jgi:hypothetical protein
MIDYLYAIVERLPRGWRSPAVTLGARPAVARRIGDLAVITSDVDGVPAGNPRTLAAHHDVIASVMEADALLPFRYGVAVPSGALEAWVAAQRGLVAATLDQVRGRIEMSVKLLRLESPVVSGLGRSCGRRGDVPDVLQLRALGERLVESAGLEQWRYRPSGSIGNVAASVAFLVSRAEVPGFLTRIAPIASHASGVAVVPTGPWPAYSFVPAFERPLTARAARFEPFPSFERRAG